ncbi:phosphoenolpyruvate synthase [Inquilinus sp.]|uniref:phosphoenolpyruvate synthase n=1 Tax=Inquilinus sp. TaxID=1932117 RepID=UPI0031E0D484
MERPLSASALPAGIYAQRQASPHAEADVRWFEAIGLDDVPLVGGKNASLGELYSAMSQDGIAVPNGFVLTAALYRDVLTQAGAWDPLHRVLDGPDPRRVDILAERAAEARRIVYDAMGDARIGRLVAENYRRLEDQYGPRVAVAVRSSATAEDLPNASFAGQHESFLNIRGADALFEAARRCFTSIFTDRAIVYRHDNGFDHFKVALSVGIMKMVRSDRASSGVIFTLDTESGFRDVVFVTGVYGLGETIVQGQVDPDEFYVHKPTFRTGQRTVLSRRLGRKQRKLIYAGRPGAGTTTDVAVKPSDRARFCISDAEVLQLAEQAMLIEDHYSQRAGHPTPMDIEWAKDAEDGRLYIIQARPETVASRRTPGVLETHLLKERGRVLVTGRAVGERIATGPARIIADRKDLERFQPGEILVARSTSPDWEPVMKIAGAIVTDQGGRTCHAAIVARELGLPAIVGTIGATQVLSTGTKITVSCAEGETGFVYEGVLPFEVATTAIDEIGMPHTAVMANLGNPELAFRTAMLPNAGVGLARMEFIISEQIGGHPMAFAHPERVASKSARRTIERLARGYSDPSEFFVERLSEGLGTLAAAFHPKPVLVRFSDFKTNEYAGLLGGSGFEPEEPNPMIGFRGASRYAHPAYADGFALECRAIRRAREDMGLANLHVMVPFCRREEEARRVLDAMAKHGLERGKYGLEIHLMCEIPNNVIRIDAFSALFDGFSIGSNDLTQLTLGVDRDSATVAFDFDECDPGMLEMLRLAVTGAKRNRRHVGICGEAPANHPDIARYLTGLGIDAISVNPSSLLQTIMIVREAESELSTPSD